MHRRVCLFLLGWGLLLSSASGAVFVVDSASDEPDADVADGLCRTAVTTCTLRAAIEQANFTAGPDVIQFSIPGTGVHTISPTSPLPPLTDDAGITIDGYSQPGAKPNTLAVGDDAVLLIEIDGSSAGDATGIRVVGAGAVIRGLVINGFNGFSQSGIWIQGGFGHAIQGCFVGTDAAGSSGRGNRGGILVEFFPAAATGSEIAAPIGVSIGGSSPADRNLISGNSSDGVGLLFLSNAVVLGNYIGVDSTGLRALGNLGNGVSVQAALVQVGGTGAEGNVISGNTGSGVFLVGTGVRVSGNLIGTDATGRSAIPNGTGVQAVLDQVGGIANNVISGNTNYGVRLNHCLNTQIAGNSIGLDVTGLPLGNGADGILILGSTRVGIGFTSNRIAFNGGAGIRIGADATDSSNDNSISRNSTHDNVGLGIDLGGDGVTLNNDCDFGRGPNLGQNFPVIDFAGAVTGGTRIAGSLNSVPGLQYTIDFYSNRACDPSGYGEGETWIGTATVSTDLNCLATFDVVVAAAVAPGSVITATATDPAGNTSEFSACRPLSVGQSFFTLPPCRIADTRDPDGPYGGPALAVGSDRTFVVAGQCGIPSDAQAVALNVTVTMPTAAGDVRLFASGTLMPLPPAVNYAAGQTRARDGIFALGIGGGIDAHVDQSAGTVHLILDVTGYFR